jgi:hypothetical protein
MIDTGTYNKLHPKDKVGTGTQSIEKLPEEIMKSEQPPPGDFLYLLPSTIYGFHMIEKRWGTIQPQ